MKYYVTGANGQLGFDLKRVLLANGHDVLATDIDTVDITNFEQVLNSIETYNPDVVIHCAAWTAVDLAEDEQESCYNVNVIGTKNIVEATKKVDAKLIHISTDYVFDGRKSGEYEVDDQTNPLGVYGQTKLEAEKLVVEYAKHFIVRITWVFGINGNNFVKTMIKLGKERDQLTVINDQVGSPTYTYDLAFLLEQISKTDKYGMYHATNEGICSWADFAREIFNVYGLDVEVKNILTSEYPTKATRPLNSRISKQKLVDNGFDLLPSWQDALRRYIEELKKEEDK